MAMKEVGLMKKVDYEMSVFAEDDLFDYIENYEDFRDFIGKCVTHFIHFVVPRRDQTNEIQQVYEIPESIEILESSVLLRREKGNKILLSFTEW